MRRHRWGGRRRSERLREAPTTLADLPACSRAVVARLPDSHGLAKRLIGLGLAPGTEVRVLQNRGHCPLIIEAHGARLALGRCQAAWVTVELLPELVDAAACTVDDEAACAMYEDVACVADDEGACVLDEDAACVVEDLLPGVE